MHLRTKIVCTIGPSVASFEKMIALIEAGMNVARLNFSHGTYEEHQRNIENLKKAREKVGRPLALMLDTAGPEIRIGKVPGDAISLAPGDRLTLALKGKGEGVIHFEWPEVFDVLAPGTRVMFDDGYIIGKVVEKGRDSAVVEIQNGGILKSGKKMNVPDVHIPIPAMTPKDMEDLRFGCEQGIDIVAASFIRSAHHVLAIKNLLAKEGRPDILVIAKIESREGVDHFDSIAQVSDGIMIARGDLGVELDLALVPKLQKMMIRKCYQACKPSITATQMLESMIANPRPTRAEASDVANAIYDCTSCIMLSGETAVGKYPIETVQRMRSIAIVAENDFNYHEFFEQNSSNRDYHDISSSVALAAVKTAYSAGAKAIFALTTSGTTARYVSRLRPEMPIVAVTANPVVYHQLALNWGVVPVLSDCKNLKEAFAAASHFALAKGIISFGDIVVVTVGAPFGKKGTTNTMMVESIGEVLVRGNRGFGSKVRGKVAVVLFPEECDVSQIKGKLVVIPHCDNTFLPVLKHAAGIILQNSLSDHSSEKYAMLIAKTFSISVMTRVEGALSILANDEEVTLDPQRGILYRGTGEDSFLV